MRKLLILAVLLSTCGLAQVESVATFRWQPVEGATWYLLEVYDGINAQAPQVYRKWYTAGQSACPDCMVSVQMDEGGYYAQVLDYGAYGYGKWQVAEYLFSVPIPPPSEWRVPTDGTFAEAMQKMTQCGTVYVDADMAEPAISYGESRTASYIVPDYGCDWQIVGDGAAVTYDPQSPPRYYDAPGILMMVKNSHKTTVTGLHFVGTMALGDGVGIDRDICLLLDAPGNMDVIGNEFEQCGHAGIKHFYGSGAFLIAENRFHDNGFTSRDHHIYLPGGGDYVIRDNYGWNASGWCVGYGNVFYTTGAQIYGNACWDNGGGISVGYGEGADVHDNIAIGNGRGLWLEGGASVFRDNVFMESTIEDVYSERACGAIVTNWCAEPVPNDFYDNGNIYETVSHPERIDER